MILSNNLVAFFVFFCFVLPSFVVIAKTLLAFLYTYDIFVGVFFFFFV